MSWEVQIARDAKKELARLPAKMQVRIGQAILGLAEEPFGHGCKRLKGRDGWRIRIGDYRVLYFAEVKTQTLVVAAIGHRSDVYRG